MHQLRSFFCLKVLNFSKAWCIIGCWLYGYVQVVHILVVFATKWRDFRKHGLDSFWNKVTTLLLFLGESSQAFVLNRFALNLSYLLLYVINLSYETCYHCKINYLLLKLWVALVFWIEQGYCNYSWVDRSRSSPDWT